VINFGIELATLALHAGPAPGSVLSKSRAACAKRPPHFPAPRISVLALAAHPTRVILIVDSIFY